MRSIYKLFTKKIVCVVVVSLSLANGFMAAQEKSDQTSGGTGNEDAVYKVGNGVSAPKPIFTPDPTYTEAARKKKINGQVTLSLIVTTEGTVRDVKVTKSLEAGLDQQSIAAVSTWKFKPAMKDGKPVAVQLNAETTFRTY